MATLLSDLHEPVPPTPADALLAHESSQRLTQMQGARGENVRLWVQPEKGPEETVAIPVSAVRLLADILTEMSKGNGVTLISVHFELTTQQAADLLNVSRPYLNDLLEKGAIPYRKVGKHRRVPIHDLMVFKRKDDEAQLKVLDELAALDQELGLGYWA